MNSFEFVNPGFLYLLLIIPVLIVWYFLKNKKDTPSLTMPGMSDFMKENASILPKFRPVLYLLRLAGLSLLIVALARPRSVDVSSKTKKQEGIDIVMAVDISGSMLSKDLKPSRLEALKIVAQSFVMERPNDRFAIVAYSGESFTMCPITSDHKVVVNSIRDMKYGLLEDGTAIGMGLGTAVNRLKDSRAKSKIIILLTDGVNNSGMIDPLTASELAVENNIIVYTIGIGTKGMAPTPIGYDHNNNFIYRNLPVEIDEDLLKEIADKTNGRYFRATSNTKLKQVYKDIDKMQKTEIKELKFYNYSEEFRPLVLLAGLLLLIEFLLRNTVFRNFL
ncbi:MAG: VWA domain-containing protein [Ichthyobacteriaceae bacterium]|nr:VWA domain-containing protein [Ichthyobacteriaceae bacterium]